MFPKAIEQQDIREYLLGRLPSEQQLLLEERLLTQDEVYEELVIVEDELVDEYLRNELSQSDREHFESHFIAAPEHQEKLRFAQTFRKYAAAEGPARQEDSAVTSSQRALTQTALSRSEPRWWGFLPIRNPMLGYAMAAALVLLAVGVSWVVWQNSQPATRDRSRVVSVVLPPGLIRGDSQRDNRVRVGRDDGTVRLQLLLPENRYSSYEGTVLDIDGRELMTQPGVRSDIVNGQATAVLDLPAEVLPPGEYRVKLNGVDEQGNRGSVANYSFRVQNP